MDDQSKTEQVVPKEASTFLEAVEPKGNSLARLAESTIQSFGIDVSYDSDPTRLFLQQKMSQAVDSGAAKAGDIVESTTGLVVAGEGKPIELIPVFARKVWVSYWADETPNKKRCSFSWTPQNNGLPYEEVVDGRPVKNELQMVWSMLSTDSKMPYIVTFRSTSFRVGKKIATLVIQSEMARKPMTILLGSQKQTGEKGSYHTFDVKPGRLVTEEEASLVTFWKGVFTHGVVADSEVPL